MAGLHPSQIITNYKFVVEHPFTRAQVRDFLLADPFKFTPLSQYKFILEKSPAPNRIMRVHIQKGSIVFAYQWPYTVSEVYLDYLVNGSMLAGRILAGLEFLLEVDDNAVDNEGDDEPGAEDYMSRPDVDQDLLGEEGAEYEEDEEDDDDD